MHWHEAFEFQDFRLECYFNSDENMMKIYMWKDLYGEGVYTNFLYHSNDDVMIYDAEFDVCFNEIFNLSENYLEKKRIYKTSLYKGKLRMAILNEKVQNYIDNQVEDIGKVVVIDDQEWECIGKIDLI